MIDDAACSTFWHQSSLLPKNFECASLPLPPTAFDAVDANVVAGVAPTLFAWCDAVHDHCVETHWCAAFPAWRLHAVAERVEQPQFSGAALI
jgi:hypothetical protein